MLAQFASQVSTTELIVIAIDIALIAIVLTLVGVLAVYHTYCLVKGQTTIEGWERTKTTRLVNQRKIDLVKYIFPFMQILFFFIDMDN